MPGLRRTLHHLRDRRAGHAAPDLEKRPVSVERLEAAIGHIKHQLRATGEREIKSRVLGELVMAELQKLDEVAYIRFASVYRRFQDLNEFREEIERLAREPAKE